MLQTLNPFFTYQWVVAFCMQHARSAAAMFMQTWRLTEGLQAPTAGQIQTKLHLETIGILFDH